MIRSLIFAAILLLIGGHSPLLGQTTAGNSSPAYTDPHLHTVQFYTEGWEFSLPVLEMGSSRRIILSFDELSGTTRSYRYSITHCNADWTPSRLALPEFLEGFPENSLNDYATSVNTTIPYVNYRLVLPNDEVGFKVSGNYLLKIWEEGHREQPVLIRPFFLSERVALIAGAAQKATFEGFNGESQQLSFSLNFPELPLSDPLNEIYTVVMQNGRWDNRMAGMHPTFIRQNQLIYETTDHPWKAGNEFRNFDAKNLQVNGVGVKSIEFRDPYYHLYLEKDYSLQKEVYLTKKDLNGQYLVKNDRAANADLESDYVFVHFTLQPPDKVTNDQIYLFGALTGWQCADINRMKYEPSTGIYEGVLLLKQGFYDYQYVLQKGDGTIDAGFLEGSHVLTENDYRIFVYYKGFGSRYDRLIGYRSINSVARER
ncbi:MAG: DUF5103 domain-containing protein [Marinilabiliales bacterium]|nr:DUF5103 domain-containing protein [Marinilabiliales bacterium]